jgi:hypothetical protein
MRRVILFIIEDSITMHVDAGRSDVLINDNLAELE